MLSLVFTLAQESLRGLKAETRGRAEPAIFDSKAAVAEDEASVLVLEAIEDCPIATIDKYDQIRQIEIAWLPDL